MLLDNKTAVIYGAAGSLGSSVARALATAGAHVILTGRNADGVKLLASEIINNGCSAECAVVDALDEQQVLRHLEDIIAGGRKLDISFNAIGYEVVQDKPLIDLQLHEYVKPVTTALETHFITCTIAARAMIRQGSGVIITLTATPGGIGYPFTGGFAPACAVIECLTRNLASEIGIYGVRVVNIRSGGSPDSRVFKDAIAAEPEVMEIGLAGLRNDTMLKQLPLMADIANTAVFLASDMASKITGVSIDVTAGTTAALNYRVMK